MPTISTATAEWCIRERERDCHRFRFKFKPKPKSHNSKKADLFWLVPQMPFCKPSQKTIKKKKRQKIYYFPASSSTSLSFQTTMSLLLPEIMWPFFGLLRWSAFFSDTSPYLLSLSISLLSLSPYYIIRATFSLLLAHFTSVFLSVTINSLFFFRLYRYTHHFIYLCFIVYFSTILQLLQRDSVFLCDSMSKKSKRAVVLDLAPPCGVGGCEDAKARLKYQTLIQDYHELQKEVDVIRSKVEAGKQRKMVLAAEVRFLRRRYEYFVKSKTSNFLQKEKLVQPPNFPKHTTKRMTGQLKLPPIPENKPKKKPYIGKESVPYGAHSLRQHHVEILHGGKAEANRQHSLTPVAYLDQKQRININKKNVKRNVTAAFDLNQKERMHANDTMALRNTTVAFDLNQDNTRSVNEVPLPSRAPTFDLNEISTGDEDFQSNFEAVKFEEVKKCLTRGSNDEVQNDLMLSVCRNAGEGSSRVGKRKISWQDPVALRV